MDEEQTEMYIKIATFFFPLSYLTITCEYEGMAAFAFCKVIYLFQGPRPSSKTPSATLAHFPTSGISVPEHPKLDT